MSSAFLESCGSTAVALGRYADAAAHYADALSVGEAARRESGRGVVGMHLGMADAALCQGDVAEARKHLAVVAPTVFDGGSEHAQARCIEAYGRVAEQTEEYELAARLLAAAATWREGQTERPPFSDVQRDLADTALTRAYAKLSEAAGVAAQASGSSMSLAQARELAQRALMT